MTNKSRNLLISEGTQDLLAQPAVGWFEITGKVDDVAAYLEKVTRLGGATVMPPTEVPQFGLTFALFTDPEGHMVGLSKGAVQ